MTFTARRRSRALALVALCVLLLLLLLLLSTTPARAESAASDTPVATAPVTAQESTVPRTQFQQRSFQPPDRMDQRVAGSALFKCQGDLLRLCVKAAEGSGPGAAQQLPTAHEVWSCMTGNIEDIRDPDCKRYIEAMVTCRRDAEQVEGCLEPATTEAVSLRRCMRQVKPEQVSTECRESEFFKSTQHPRW